MHPPVLPDPLRHQFLPDLLLLWHLLFPEGLLLLLVLPDLLLHQHRLNHSNLPNQYHLSDPGGL